MSKRKILMRYKEISEKLYVSPEYLPTRKLWNVNGSDGSRAGLPDCTFMFIPKIPICKYFGRHWNEHVGIFCCHLVFRYMVNLVYLMADR
jgi:hypothetical protein